MTTKKSKSKPKSQRRKLVLTRDMVDAERLLLPHRNNTFNLVDAGVSLCYTQSINQALSEVARVLRPGGRAELVVWVKDGRDYDRRTGVYYFARKEYAAAIRRHFKIIESTAMYTEPLRARIKFIGERPK